jgi:FtsZ-binding cell division protein ZapB
MEIYSLANVMKENEELKLKIASLIQENREVNHANEFLKQRNKDLRQKTYINVYDENLKMIDEIKALKHENFVKFNALVKYEENIEKIKEQLRVSAKIADDFYQDKVQLEKENHHLKEVIESVQTFIGQFTK